MSIAFRAAASTHNFYASTSVVVNKPTGTVDGDLMIAIIGGTPSTLAGWTSIGSAASGTSMNTVGAFWKKASGEGASYTWTITTSDCWGVIVSYSGCDPTTPVDTTHTTTAAHTGTAFTPTSITVSQATQLMVGWAQEYKFDGTGSGSTTWTVTGATSRSTSSNVTGASPNTEQNSYVICDKTPGTGSQTQTLTASQASDGGVSGLILLNAAGVSVAPGVATVTAAGLGPTAVEVPGAAAGKASATAAANNPSVAIGVPAGVATATTAGSPVVLGRAVTSAGATAAGRNATVLIGWLANAGRASVTATGLSPQHIGLGIFPSSVDNSATAYNPVVNVPGQNVPARTYVVPVENRRFIADPTDVRIIMVQPDA